MISGSPIISNFLVRIPIEEPDSIGILCHMISPFKILQELLEEFKDKLALAFGYSLNPFNFCNHSIFLTFFALL